MKELHIRIIEVKEMTSKEGRKFTVYKSLTKEGKLMDTKFRKEVKDLPTEPCMLIVDSDQCNVTKNTQYPTLWIKAVKAIEPFVRESNAESYFD